MKVKKARILKGRCQVCEHWVKRGDFFFTTGIDWHGRITGLRHQACKENKPVINYSPFTKRAG